MKRRVRGLLRRKWGKPFLALLLAGLPMLIALAVTTFLMDSFSDGLSSIVSQVFTIIREAPDRTTAFITLVFGFEPDISRLIEGLPALAVLLGTYLFIGLPISVSVSSYFLAFLRGKNPSPFAVYSCFSAKYPRFLGGMAYMLLWTAIWIAMAFAAPFALYSVLLSVIESFAGTLGFSQIPLLGGLIIICIVWFVAFTMQFVNRTIAYSLTSLALAAQPRLPARRAMRLSRKLIRGNKWELISLHLSFLVYYLPALFAALLLVLLPGIASLTGLTESPVSIIRTCLYALMGANALITVFVAPYMAACRRAFYIERKREALMDDEVTQADFIAPKKLAALQAPERAEELRRAISDETGPIPSLSNIDKREAKP